MLALASASATTTRSPALCPSRRHHISNQSLATGVDTVGTCNGAPLFLRVLVFCKCRAKIVELNTHRREA